MTKDAYQKSGNSPPRWDQVVYVHRDGVPVLETWSAGTPASPPKPLPDPVPIKKRRRRWWA